MLLTINLFANTIIFLASIWALFTDKIPTKIIGSTFLFLLSICSINNIQYPIFNINYIIFMSVISLGIIWIFYKVEIKK